MLVGRQQHYCTTIMLTSKWRDMSKKVQRFKNIYNAIALAADEDEALADALVEYHEVYNNEFKNLDVWTILKDNPDL
jgi:hypothetical protein